MQQILAEQQQDPKTPKSQTRNLKQLAEVRSETHELMCCAGFDDGPIEHDLCAATICVCRLD